ncbi:TetR/AcrR family transcriptional regulator [Kibdelosporangium philippinense]|uniref:TetR/AcrR family transcriptional regulator n=1 Tax=Kibdelosporangium philippinense TaxID=211113 RepID=A0ABS8Z4K2_9PSEU|nr:TetR/AcrR family transcriptional regulator [Kibdelosporangium philippinense]MCE7002856.1 TetR/AcrR family transcriptional regulator [Kibdelosporangium philippinense]
MGSSAKRAHPDPDKRAAVERRVLQATEELLLSGVTYDALGVGRIATAAGIARSTFYLYFADKPELIKRLAEKLKEGLFELGSDWAPSDGLAALAAIYVRMIEYYRPRMPILAAISQVVASDPDVRDAWQSTVERFADHMAACIADEQRAGRTSADIDPLLAAHVMTWGGEQVITRQAASGDPDRDAAVAQELAIHRWYGVFRRPVISPDTAAAPQ